MAKLEAFAYEQAGRPNVPFLRPNTDKEDQEERVAETLARMVAEMSDYTEPGQPVKGSKWVSHYRPPGESRFIEEGD